MREGELLPERRIWPQDDHLPRRRGLLNEGGGPSAVGSKVGVSRKGNDLNLGDFIVLPIQNGLDESRTRELQLGDEHPGSLRREIGRENEVIADDLTPASLILREGRWRRGTLRVCAARNER
jgi:hypothetical protein